MNWKQAKLYQLYEIAFNDENGEPFYIKQAAAQEIRRRRKKKFPKVNFREKVTG